MGIVVLNLPMTASKMFLTIVFGIVFCQAEKLIVETGDGLAEGRDYGHQGDAMDNKPDGYQDDAMDDNTDGHQDDAMDDNPDEHQDDATDNKPDGYKDDAMDDKPKCKCETDRNCRGCFHEGKWYDLDQVVPKDKCNNCWCEHNNTIPCTKMECIDKDDLLDKIKPKCKEESDTNCRGCIHEGTWYEKGKSIPMHECNHCKCVGDHEIGCTLGECTEPKCKEETDTNCRGCFHEGKWYEKGMSVPMDECNTCWCKGDHNIACTAMACVTVPTKKPKKYKPKSTNKPKKYKQKSRPKKYN